MNVTKLAADLDRLGQESEVGHAHIECLHDSLDDAPCRVTLAGLDAWGSYTDTFEVVSGCLRKGAPRPVHARSSGEPLRPDRCLLLRRKRLPVDQSR